MNIEEQMEATALRHRMFDDATGAVLAVSGGPDSLALLHLMHAFQRKRFPRLRLHVAHLHHGMRGAEADEDAEFVKRQAAALGIECAVGHADVPGLAVARGVGEEVAGRDARYGLLTRVAEDTGANRLVLGHHAGDQAETVLMRSMRGAGPRGMAGIPYVRAVQGKSALLVVRPLLDVSRAEIEAYLTGKGLKSRLDRTNLSPKYLRNRLRADIMPDMERGWGTGLPAGLCALAACTQRLVAQGDALRDASLRDAPVIVEEQFIEIAIAWFQRLPPAMRVEVLRSLLHGANLPVALDREHYQRIDAMLEARDAPESLPGDIVAALDGDSLILCPSHSEGLDAFRAELPVPGTVLVPLLRGQVSAEILSGPVDLEELKASEHKPFEELFDLEKVALPLTARFIRAGDRMRPLGAPGTRKMQDILTDLGVSKWRRRRTLLIEAANGPAWLVGFRIADALKLRDATRRILRLRLARRG